MEKMDVKEILGIGFTLLMEIRDLLKNKNRLEILNLLKKEGDLNITKITEKTNLAYKNVLAHLKSLEEVYLIKTEKQEKKRGREVIVTLTSSPTKFDKEVIFLPN